MLKILETQQRKKKQLEDEKQQIEIQRDLFMTGFPKERISRTQKVIKEKR